MAAEENQMPEGDLFPPTEELLGDVIYSFVGIWLAMSVILPIKNKEQVIATMDNMAEMIKRMQNHISNSDPEQFKRDLSHCLRKGMTPRIWQI